MTLGRRIAILENDSQRWLDCLRVGRELIQQKMVDSENGEEEGNGAGEASLHLRVKGERNGEGGL